MSRNDSGITPARQDRYTLDGDDAVENRIDKDQQLIGQAVVNFFPSSIFSALVLIGGYARGEGGFCYIDGKPAPYNDYDYFIVVKNLNKAKQREWNPKLQKLAKELEQQVGIEVDFFFLSEESLSGAEFSLMFAEMQWGNRVIAGDPDVLAVMPPMPFAKLPLAEFTRLMLNRGSLLLLNKQARLAGEPSNALQHEIFVKYLFKAILAIVDSHLAVRRIYHPSYPEKLKLLESIAEQHELIDLLDMYRLALEARFHPNFSQYSSMNLDVWQNKVLQHWLHAMSKLESARRGEVIQSWNSYASPRVDKGQSATGIKAIMRNVAITARDYGLLEVIVHPAWARRYPRERIISVLPLLLQKDANTQLAAIYPILGITENKTLQDCIAAFLEQWKRYA